MNKIFLIFITVIGLVKSRLLNDINCGRDAVLGEVPYHASLQYWKSNEHFASGAMLNSRWVLSTAHGLVGLTADSINIILGSIQFDKPLSVRRSTEIRIHPLYDAISNQNDIAVIRGSNAINYPPNIHPVTLSPLFIEHGTTAQISGWNPNSTIKPSLLQISEMKTIQCVDKELVTFAHQYFCTEMSKPLSRGCEKDAGSPLVSQNMLIGIKFHQNLGEYESTFSFLRISFYRSWILANTSI